MYIAEIDYTIRHTIELITQEFIENVNPKLCVLSTMGERDQPESAVMAYAVMSGLTIILSTHKDTRKWKNIQKHPNVSLVFGWDFSKYNVQYDGSAQLILDDKETEQIYFAANPELVKFRNMPGNAFIRVTPSWIRLSDFSISPPKIMEKRF